MVRGTEFDAGDGAGHSRRADILYMDDALDDLALLDGSARKRVLADLQKLETEPAQRGLPLGSRRSGNLTGLRKLPCGPRKAYRAVFAVRADGKLSIVMVVAERSDDECYEMARARLELVKVAPQYDPMVEQLKEILGVQ